MSEYLGIFLDELEEQLQILDEQLLELERDASDADTIGLIFRAAHTLKGSSAAMGFAKIKELTHQMENIFDLMRADRLMIGGALMNALFQCVDEIKAMKDAIQAGRGEEERDIGALVKILSVYTREAEGDDTVRDGAARAAGSWELEGFQREAIAQAWDQRMNAFRICAAFLADEAFAYARALMLYRALEELGDVIATFPSVEELERQTSHYGQIVMLLLTPESEARVNEAALRVSQFERLEVSPMRLDEPGPDASAAAADGGNGGAPEDGAPGGGGPSAAANAAKPGGRAGATVRVDVERLEALLNLVGELLIDNTRLQEVRRRLEEQYREQPEVIELGEIGQHIGKVIGELQDGMMKTRMLPIEQLFNRFPRMMRDVAQQLGKEIRFAMEGKETELDRTLIEEISDPIIHILRNSADHAIEPPEERARLGKPRSGTVTLKAAHEDNHIVISVSDDGRGIDAAGIRAASVRKGIVTQAEADRMSDAEAARLIFQSGVSTARQVTDLSGRGVGMDIVRAHIERLNGLIDIETEAGAGTTFTIKLPLTLAIIRALLVQVEDRTFALPLANVVEIVRLEREQVQTIQGQDVCLIRGEAFPLVSLRRKLGMLGGVGAERRGERPLVVMVGVAERRVCLVVDRTIGNQEIVIKSLGTFVGQVPYIAGATLLGDGRIALILDAAMLAREEGLSLRQQEADRGREAAKTSAGEQYVSFRMETEMYALRTSGVKEIIRAPQLSTVASAPNAVMGMIQLRGRTVPVLDLSRSLNLPPRRAQPTSRIIVMDCGSREVGFWTDEIGEVFKVLPGEAEAAEEVLPAARSEWIEGIYHAGGRMIALLKVDEAATLRDAMLAF